MEINDEVNAYFNELERQLCYLAMEWRGNVDRREDIRIEYEGIMEKLFSLDWNDILDIECELPDDVMPSEYIKRNSRKPSSEKSWKKFWRGE